MFKKIENMYSFSVSMYGLMNRFFFYVLLFDFCSTNLGFFFICELVLARVFVS